MLEGSAEAGLVLEAEGFGQRGEWFPASGQYLNGHVPPILVLYRLKVGALCLQVARQGTDGHVQRIGHVVNGAGRELVAVQVLPHAMGGDTVFERDIKPVCWRTLQKSPQVLLALPDGMFQKNRIEIDRRFRLIEGHLAWIKIEIVSSMGGLWIAALHQYGRDFSRDQPGSNAVKELQHQLMHQNVAALKRFVLLEGHTSQAALYGKTIAKVIQHNTKKLGVAM